MGAYLIISLLEKEIRAEQEFCQGTALWELVMACSGWE